MDETLERALEYVKEISRRGISIYDPIEVGDPSLWLPAPELEAILDQRLQGLNLGFPIRTRSKVFKSAICVVLGYPVPRSFTKRQPRFPGQDFDTYVQKANNLQVWNEQLTPTRRYVLGRVSAEDLVTGVKVVDGEELARLDTTGTLTQKYQARLELGHGSTELVTDNDTENLQCLVNPTGKRVAVEGSPTDHPTVGALLPISLLFERLSRLLGMSVPVRGHDQERLRGAELHRLVCQELGYRTFADDGHFPDVRNQLLEVKLQTAPTIDLGLVLPSSESALDVPMLNGRQILHRDVRYAIYFGSAEGSSIVLSHFFLTTGEGFFGRFPQFGGRVLNKKLQIHLPGDYFDR